MKTLNYKNIWDGAMNYASYRQLIAELITEGKTTGPDQSQSLIDYTALNAQRMKRIDKTYSPNSEIVNQLVKRQGKVVFLTITESWCGDAAQIVPVISALAEAANISARCVLRDENLDLIDHHLTNGGRSIPIIVVLDAQSFEVIGSWGPRPSEVQTMVMDYKKLPEPKPAYSEFSKQVQLWYAKDKYKSIEREFSEMVIKASVSFQ
jgi:thiol-disulfide isomerase/thioredoxin